MGNGLNIILVARRQNLLDEKSTVLQSKYGIKVKTIQADLTKPEDIQKVIDGTKDLEVGLLIPGAAFETHGAFYKIPVEKELALIQLNISSTMVLTHHFTGEMVKRKKRWCCINFQYDRSHAQSLFSPITPVQKLISSTLEPPLIENLKKHGVDVSVLSPGPTETPMISESGMDMSKLPMSIQKPEFTAKAGLDALGKKPVVIPGFKNNMLVTTTNMMPNSVATKMGANMIEKVLDPDLL